MIDIMNKETADKKATASGQSAGPAAKDHIAK
jgi:hypothetical protein